MKRTNTTTFSTLKIENVEIYKENGNIKSVKIFNKVYQTIPEEKILNELKENGIVRFIYLTLRHKKHDNNNTVDEFFYIGQHRATSISKVLKYFGSGKIVKVMYKEHPEEFEKCYLLLCKSNEDMNEKERSIVTKDIINMKPYCLNLVDGGNQVNWMKYKSEDEIRKIYLKSSETIKQYCKDHPNRQEKSSKFMKEYFKDDERRKYRGEKIKEWNKTCLKEKMLSHEKKRKTFIKNHSLSVSVYDLDGNFIKEFNHSVDCVDYLVNDLKLSVSKISTRSIVNKSVRYGNVSFHGLQFKHFDDISPLKIKPFYSKISFAVYSNTHKPIYIFHSINQLSSIVSPFISKSPLELAITINSRIVHNTPYLNMYYKRIKHMKQDELDKLIEELKNSKPSDIFKYIDFNQLRSHRFNKPK